MLTQILRRWLERNGAADWPGITDPGPACLRQPTRPLATIAHRIGYSTEFAFRASLRPEYGISPGRFRDIKGGERATR